MGVLEAWVLFGLAAFQIALVAWWWRGPSLSGTRGLVVGLFLLNALSTLGNGIAALEGSMDAAFLLAVREGIAPSDRASDLFLLAILLVAVRGFARAPVASGTVMVVGFLAWAVTAFGSLTPPLGLGGGDDAKFAAELPLQAAVMLTPLAVAIRLRDAAAPERTAWLLILGALSLRFAEVATLYWLRRPFTTPIDLSWTGATVLIGTAGFLAAVATFALLLAAWTRSRGGDRSIEVALWLVSAGFLLGAAQRSIVDLNPTLVYFSLGLVRPIAFLVAQGQLDGNRRPFSERSRGAAIGAAVHGIAFIGVALAGSAWAMDPGSSLLVGAAFLALTMPIAIRYAPRAPRTLPAALAPNLDGLPAARAWPLEVDRVPLPEDWQARTDAGFATYQRLRPEAQAGLASLRRWQRLLLALHTIPDDADPASYDRTTPGLHLATHCPYASIGPELARVNKRAGTVLRELEVPSARPGVHASTLLVESTWGTSHGTRSGRVRRYMLTSAGSEAAAAIRARHHLDSLPDDTLAAVLGEAYGAPPLPAASAVAGT